MHSTELAVRFWAKVHKDPVTQCWNWQSATSSGYGKLWIKGSGKKYDYAHRVSWELKVGTIPKDLSVLHTCDNRRCVNPDHLFLGTDQDNVTDMVTKQRHPVGERRWNAKISTNLMRNLRALFEAGMSQKLIQRLFGVNVYNFTRGKCWRCIPTNMVYNLPREARFFKSNLYGSAKS